MPTRMCAVCRTRLPKGELLRHITDEKGQLVPDVAQRLPGRGIYVCSGPTCRERLAHRAAAKKSRANKASRALRGQEEHAG